jgi:alpha-beta hydrolase superfamily lysophospholipase
MRLITAYLIRFGRLLVLFCIGFSVHASSINIQATTADGIAIYGQQHFADLGLKAPLVLLFHQGGSNGQGEYNETIPWLNKQGFRAITWDLRSGGKTYGFDNRTVSNLPNSVANGYCDAFADLQAALDYVEDKQLAKSVIALGSSYSAALVFQLAAKNPDNVSHVIGFSPASGGPLAACKASLWVDKIKVPMLVMRPQSEMSRSSSIEQKKTLTNAGVGFHIVEQGVHGSSMLIDSRTGHDMTKARAFVIDWLKGAKQ